MLNFIINTNSPQASNIFLRKLWSELNDLHPMGWNMYPHKVENRITIGTSNLGEISFDYSRRGCIRNLYIDSPFDVEAITHAVRNAQHNSLSEYTVLLELSADSSVNFVTSSLGKCKLYSKAGTAYLIAGVKAYSEWDAKMFLPNKFLSIASVLYEYTHSIFAIKSCQIAKHSFAEDDTNFNTYNYSWLESDECPTTEDNYLIVPDECLKLLAYILDDESYSEDIELLLNSSNLLFTTRSMLVEIEFPHSRVRADILNSMICSTLEPLSLILDKSTEQCSACGNKIFSISQKIKKMCTRYFDESFAKYVCNVIYKNRSIFLHNGHPETTQRSNGVFLPQINPTTGMIMLPEGRPRYEAFEWSTFLFRNIAHDYYAGALE